MAQTDTSLLQAALVGYQAEAEKLANAIADLKKRLGTRGGVDLHGPLLKETARKKHRISAEGRARIAAAQKRRWASSRKNAKTMAAGG